MKGLFITLEGIDFSGKTTQARKLASYLRENGYGVLLIREPGGDRISEKIRKILLSEKNAGMSELAELLLYEASRAQLTQKMILPALREGKVVVCDRYYDSTLAYQGYGRGLDKKIITYLNHIATLGLSPDLTILIDVPVKVSLQRKVKNKRKEDRLEKERIEFHKKIRGIFKDRPAKQNQDQSCRRNRGRFCHLAKSEEGGGFLLVKTNTIDGKNNPGA
jgi:dTMP kinase